MVGTVPHVAERSSGALEAARAATAPGRGSSVTQQDNAQLAMLMDGLLAAVGDKEDVRKLLRSFGVTNHVVDATVAAKIDVGLARGAKQLHVAGALILDALTNDDVRQAKDNIIVRHHALVRACAVLLSMAYTFDNAGAACADGQTFLRELIQERNMRGQLNLLQAPKVLDDHRRANAMAASTTTATSTAWAAGGNTLGGGRRFNAAPRVTAGSGRAALADTAPLCTYCKRGRHATSECWTKNPNLAPAEQRALFTQRNAEAKAAKAVAAKNVAPAKQAARSPHPETGADE